MKNFKSILGPGVIFVFFTILSLACASSGKLSGSVPDSFSEIVELSGSKDSIYTKANLVFVDLFNNAESVIQFSDKQEGVIKGKYVSIFDLGLSTLKATSTVEVSVKDGKYRINITLGSVTEISNALSRYSAGQLKPTDEILTKMNQEWKTLSEEFKTRMYSNSSW